MKLRKTLLIGFSVGICMYGFGGFLMVLAPPGGMISLAWDLGRVLAAPGLLLSELFGFDCFPYRVELTPFRVIAPLILQGVLGAVIWAAIVLLARALSALVENGEAGSKAPDSREQGASVPDVDDEQDGDSPQKHIN